MSKHENCPFQNCLRGEPIASHMTLRDHFAAMAMQGIISTWNGTVAKELLSKAQVAADAYEMADAMLAQRVTRSEVRQ